MRLQTTVVSNETPAPSTGSFFDGDFVSFAA